MFFKKTKRFLPLRDLPSTNFANLSVTIGLYAGMPEALKGHGGGGGRHCLKGTSSRTISSRNCR